MKTKYTRESAIEILRSAGAANIGYTFILKSGSLGLRKLGAIDYLVKYHGYSVVWK